MFSSSVALMHTKDKNWFLHMHDLVLQAGFKESRMFPKSPAGLSRFRRGPLPFVFLHGSLETSEVRRAFTEVRAHTDVCIRFLPIIVLTETNDAASILRFIQMGSDDIVSMPLTAARLIERLKYQVAQPKDYFQTDTYFGPDRRQHALTRDTDNAERDTGDHFFRHFSVKRHPQRGITILSTDVHYPAEQVPAQAVAQAATG